MARLPESWLAAAQRSGLLVDTNLLVLWVVDEVNPKRIATFKRTSKYTSADCELLQQILDQVRQIYACAHILSEVSNLTDLPGDELESSREVLRELITQVIEPAISSQRASSDESFVRLGLTDAAIVKLAEEHELAVLTDDLALYVVLLERGIPVVNFTYLRGL